MTRFSSIIVWLLCQLVAFSALVASASSQTPPEPVYIYLFSHTEDHINLTLSEERFTRVLPMLEALHADFPQYRPNACFQFYGADSETLSSGVVSDALAARDAGYLLLGYHGAHEPTYTNNPIGNINYATATWLEIQDTMEVHLSAHRDLLRGTLSPFGEGALARTDSTFGPLTTLSGLESFDPARAHAIDATHPDSLLLGYSGHMPSAPPTYMSGVDDLSTLLAPTTEHVRQLHWARHHLRVSGTDGTANFDSRGMDGVAHLQSKLALLDRTHPNVLMMSIGSKTIYALQSPTGYAYNNPLSPQLPSSLLRSRIEIDANYANVQDVLNWLVNVYFPANPGSRFVSAADLKAAFPSRNGESVDRIELLGFARNLIATWDTGASPATPPPYVESQGAYLSLCDMMQCLVGMLAGYGPLLPTEVPLGRAIGPLASVTASATAPSVSRIDLLAAAASLDPALNADTWTKTPSNTVPEQVAVGTTTVNAAELLYLFAQLFVDLSEGRTPATVQAPASDMLDPAVLDAQNKVSTLTTKWPYLDWDLKPANLAGFPPRLSTTGTPVAGGTIEVHLTDDPGSEGTLAVSTRTASRVIPGLGELLIDLSVGRILPNTVALGGECYATWTVAIPPSFHGTAYAQAMSTRNGESELSDLLTVMVP